MKTIVQGFDPNKMPLRGECSHCHTVVEFLPLEAEHVSDQRDGDFYKVTCPTCARSITASVPRYNGPG